MERFCVIIPDRGDRKELTEFCFRQLDRMTLKPDKIYHINHQAMDDNIDIISRVAHGVERAEMDGIDLCFIIENDDYYPADYFESYAPFIYGHDFFGYEDTTYYNIKTKTWQRFEHVNRSSLFCTGFRASALKSFNWPSGKRRFLDISIWDHAAFKMKAMKLLDCNPCLGIKGHGFGMMGGKGHVIRLKENDENLSFLGSKVDDMAFWFYTDLIKYNESISARV
jgi:hypothetical protein